MSRGALSGLRVVEFGSLETLYAGKLLADQGADVLLVEPAGGHVSRRTGPFAPDPVDETASALFTYLNGNKRTVELPADSDRSRAALEQLISDAELVLAGGRPAELERAGIDTSLAASRLLVTVTPFGWHGPWRDLHADELTLNALGGMMSLGGYWDDRPLQPPAGLMYASSATFAAVGAMTHLATGAVQVGHVDVSIQESIVMALENAAQFWDLEGLVRRRSGDRDTQVGRGVYRCADGYVYVMLGLSAGSAFWTRFLAWLDEWDVPGRDALAGDRWAQREFIESDEAKQVFRDVVETMFRSHTRAELAATARRHLLPIAPVNEVADLFADEQLAARDYFVDVPRSDWSHGPARAPGAPYRLAATPGAPRYAPQTRLSGEVRAG